MQIVHMAYNSPDIVTPNIVTPFLAGSLERGVNMGRFSGLVAETLSDLRIFQH